MSDTAPASSETAPARAEKEQDSFTVFLLKLLLVILIFRSFIFSPFNIPSESMLPRLWNGDYLLAAKWPYGYSRHSLPFSLPLIPGRFFASEPERGDVVIFKAPPRDDTDYIKRVIGLPGDQVQMQGGRLILNGQPVAREQMEDFVIPVSANTRCYHPRFVARNARNEAVCRYPQFRETLPGGRSYAILDLAQTPQDDTEVFIVPENSLFLMGDNRDNSLDGRFPAIPGQGIGIVPQDNLVGKATIIMFSTDGSASWIKPWTWFTAARWDRVGETI